MLEYTMLFFLVVGTITGMSIFFKRGVQARMRDARNFMFLTVQNRAQNYYDGNLYAEYEPYYANTQSLVRRSESDNIELLPSPGFSSGIFRKIFLDTTIVNTISVTAPPAVYNKL